MILNRGVRMPVVVLFLGVGVGDVSPGQEATPASRPPNILLLMTDQQSHGVLGCAGNAIVRTPNLDRLASQGVRITRAVCATPFCTPTRASIRTGQWPHTHGLVRNVAPDQNYVRQRRQKNKVRPRPDRPDLGEEQVVLDNLLFDAGYRLEHWGKWHLGDPSDLHCYAHKAEEEGDRVAYTTWRERLGESVVSREARPGETFQPTEGGLFVTEAVARGSAVLADDEEGGGREAQSVGRSAVAPRAQLSTWLTDRAIEWLEKHADRPFMLTLSLSPPHAPWIAPDPYYSLYDPATMVLPASFGHRPPAHRNAQATRMGEAMGEAGLREYLRCYYAQVTMVDEQFGRLLGKLHDLGLDRHTLVIFTSDHGDLQAAHGMMGKSAQSFYEEVVRVPLLIRYPPTIQPGQVLDLHVNSVDLMPTILEYAGLPIPDCVQGRSLRPILDGRVPPDDRPAFCERGRDGRSAHRMMRTAEWKYSVYGDGRRELFDLRQDPGEIRNLADDPAFQEQRKRFDGQLHDWMRATNDPALDDLSRPAG